MDLHITLIVIGESNFRFCFRSVIAVFTIVDDKVEAEPKTALAK